MPENERYHGESKGAFAKRKKLKGKARKAANKRAAAGNPFKKAMGY